MRKEWLAALLAGGLLQGCQTDAGNAPGPAKVVASSAAAAQAKKAPLSSSASAESLFERGGSKPIEFVKVQYNIPRGAQIGVSKGSIAQCWGRGAYTDRILYWSEARVTERDREFADAFFYAASDAGLDVVGDPRRLFEEREERSRATMAVAAEIVSINLDICDEVDWLDRRIGEMSGAGEVEVVWHLYDKLQRRVVLTTATRGRAALKDLPNDDVKVFVTEAFAEAARTLAQSDGFRSAVAKSSGDGHSTKGLTASGLPSLTLARADAFEGPLSRRAEHARRATVTIDLGDAHGSGFIVDARGFILTNHHVVGERERIRIRFSDGKEAIGEVLRRDRLRDVALVKIEGGDHAALPIRAAPAAIAEEVFAIGAPLDPALSNSVTKGVVSAIRSRRDGMVYIQADVNIQGGNSGGPLVDGSGNVVGISVAGIREEGVMTGINFFIPIHDALDRLNLKLAVGPTS